MTVLSPNDCRLRPLEEADLESVRRWRNSDRIRSVMYSDELITEESQRRWFAGLAGKPDRLYLIFEVKGKPAGLVYFNPIEREKKQATWGFYLGEEKSPEGSGRILGRLGLEYAFSNLRVDRVLAETFAFNERGIRFHDRLGFNRDSVVSGEHVKNGKPQDVVRFSLDRTAWAR